jgi:hypothetical protein
MRVVFHPEADREYVEVAQYYERQRAGLGALAVVRSCVGS